MGKLKLGWIGLGNMGIPMATNLLKAGFDVAVFNRTKDKEQVLIEAGASSADSPKQLIESCDVVFTMLSDDNAVKAVFEGTSGLLAGHQSGKLIIDMSTVSPDTSRYLSESCSSAALHFMEAPVSGSVKPAQDGALIILAAGTEEDYETARPMFEVLGRLSFLLGPAGTGSSAKLAINYLLGLNLQGLAETVLFAEQNGVRKADMLSIINESACGNGITKLKSPSILNDAYPAAFALKLLVKDLRLAAEAGLESPLAKPLSDTFSKARDAGYGEDDVMAILKFLQK